MEIVCEKGKCTGCMECIDICPKNAIQIDDIEKEYNALIDSSKCIKCNACHKACQNNREMDLVNPICWNQGWAADNKIRMESSSGGVATAIERAFVRNGGVVCSCTFRSGRFEFDFAETENEVSKFTGSKYVKSNPRGIYKKVLGRLRKGERVLFVGLPCQVAAIRHYTGEHRNLYTIDLICHGTPSPKILERFLGDYDIKLAEVEHIKFRVKSNFKLERNGKRFATPTTTDNYLMVFLKSTSYTENCYECRYAQLGRVGDITLGDSWGSELEKQIQDKGVSLIFCQNEKGKKLIDESELILMNVDLNMAIKNNHQLQHPSLKPKQREIFFRELSKGHGLNTIVRKCYPKEYLRNVVKSLLYKMKSGGAEHLSSNSCYDYKWQSQINILNTGNIVLRLNREIYFI